MNCPEEKINIIPAVCVLPFQAFWPIKPTSLIRDADLNLRIAGLPAYKSWTLEAVKQDLGDPPALMCRL